ncbi:MAG TPA: hypothetical protein PLP19_14715 [bacterium]|nr:hypothetical protein [bacterium]HPN44742.1 hypothetical protein [bacterium]
MEIQFRCSSCGAKYQENEQMAGQKGKCKHCGANIEVPIIIHDNTPLPETIDNKSNDIKNKKSEKIFKLGKIFKVTSLSIVIIAILILGTKFGYNYYRVFQLKHKLEEAIGKNAGYTETILKVESEASGMTFKELFDLCEKSIADRTNLIIELRGLYPDINFELKEKLIIFLNDENELIRAKRAFYNHQLDFTSSVELFQNHISDTPTSLYGWDYYTKRTNLLKSELIQEITKIINSADNFKSNYVKLVEQENILTNSMNNENIRFPTIFKQYEESNIKLADDSITTAKEIEKNLI